MWVLGVGVGMVLDVGVRLWVLGMGVGYGCWVWELGMGDGYGCWVLRAGVCKLLSHLVLTMYSLVCLLFLQV